MTAINPFTPASLYFHCYKYDFHPHSNPHETSTNKIQQMAKNKTNNCYRMVPALLQGPPTLANPHCFRVHQLWLTLTVSVLYVTLTADTLTVSVLYVTLTADTLTASVLYVTLTADTLTVSVLYVTLTADTLTVSVLYVTLTADTLTVSVLYVTLTADTLTFRDVDTPQNLRYWMFLVCILAVFPPSRKVLRYLKLHLQRNMTIYSGNLGDP